MQKKTGTTAVVDARATPLTRKVAAGSDAEIELLAFEIEGFLRWKEHLAAVRAQPPTTSRTKEKIVRALRKKS
jgi:hypothetical protein